MQSKSKKKNRTRKYMKGKRAIERKKNSFKKNVESFCKLKS